MRTMIRRVRRLEERFAPRVDEEKRSLAAMIRERRRRRLAAEGRAPEADRPPLVDDGYRLRTLSEAIRHVRVRRQSTIAAEADAGLRKHDQQNAHSSFE